MLNKLPDYIDKYKYVLITFISFGVYAQAISFGLTYCDDHDIILTYFERISKFSYIVQEFLKGYIGTEYYRPLINISFLLDAQIAGQNLWIYHLSNIIYHTLFAVFLCKLLEKLEINKSAALAGTIIFVVHPLNINAVAWIVGRNDSIMALFSILAFISLLNYEKKQKYYHLFLFGIFLLLSILSKESAFFFIPVIFYFIYFVAKAQLKSKTILFSTVTVVLAMIVWFIARSNAELGKNINSMGFEVFISNMRVIPEYIGKFFLPLNTSVLATYSVYNTISGLVIMLVLVIITFYISRLRQLNYKRLVFGAVWFLFPVLPVLLIQIINVEDWNEYVECRAYLPVAGLIIYLTELLPKDFYLFNKKNGFALLLILLALTSITVIKSASYRDSITFYESAVNDNPRKPLFHFVLSRRYRDAGMFDKEEQSIMNAMYLRPEYAKYPYNLGIFFYNLKNNDSAVKYLNIALELNPKYREVYKPLGLIYYLKEDYISAYRVWSQAKLHIENPEEFELNTVAALFMMGNYQALDSLLAQFTSQKKYPNELYNFFLTTGERLSGLRKYEKAIEAFNYCIRLNPGYLDPYFRLLTYYAEIEKNKGKATYYLNLIKLTGERIPEELLQKISQLK